MTPRRAPRRAPTMYRLRRYALAALAALLALAFGAALAFTATAFLAGCGSPLTLPALPGGSVSVTTPAGAATVRGPWVPAAAPTTIVYISGPCAAELARAVLDASAPTDASATLDAGAPLDAEADR